MKTNNVYMCLNEGKYPDTLWISIEIPETFASVGKPIHHFECDDSAEFLCKLDEYEALGYTVLKNITPDDLIIKGAPERFSNGQECISIKIPSGKYRAFYVE